MLRGAMDRRRLRRGRPEVRTLARLPHFRWGVNKYSISSKFTSCPAVDGVCGRVLGRL